MQGTSKCLTRACAFASSLDIVHDVPHIMYDWLEGSTKNEYVHVPLPCMYSYTHTYIHVPYMAGHKEHKLFTCAKIVHATSAEN